MMGTQKILEIPASEKKKLVENGWLGKDEICRFPEDVKAFPSGIKLRGLPDNFWKIADDALIKYAIDRGWILFVDGDGKAMTKSEYMKKYPKYPDPEIVMRLMKKLPPGDKTFYVIR